MQNSAEQSSGSHVSPALLASNSPQTPACSIGSSGTSLDDVLRQYLLHFDDTISYQQSHIVLEWLQSAARQWIGSLERAKDPDDVIVVQAFGSHRLGFATGGSDLDAVLITSCRSVSRDTFCHGFVTFLQGKAPLTSLVRAIDSPNAPIVRFLAHPFAAQLRAALLCQAALARQCPTTAVPASVTALADPAVLGEILLWGYPGVPVDLSLSLIDRPPRALSPQDLVWSPEVRVHSRDQASENGLAAVRVAETVAKEVPDLSRFRWALKVVKRWAQQKLIYGKIYGFPGGVAWMLLVAKVCQENEDLLTCEMPVEFLSKFLPRFFDKFAHHEWGRFPVELRYDPKLFGELKPAPRRMGRRVLQILTPDNTHENVVDHMEEDALRRMVKVLQKADVLCCRKPV
eukprot:RCo045354